jgi:PAS domain S-box-containing protein
VTRDGWSGFFETAFKQSRNAMVLVDDRRIQIDVNGAYLKLLGYQRAGVIGQPLGTVHRRSGADLR